ncbi:MAG TPA: hypothetical protein VGQ87_03080, partial [Patescibacteria group bacterium]|nr:hypothetical protein [Patescibacteria group bacterium]
MDTEKIPAKKRISSKKAPELRHDFDNDGPIIIPGARISHYKPSKFDFSFIKRLDKVSKKTSKIANFILPPKPETKRNKTAFSALRKTQRVVEATSFKQTGQKIFNLRGQVASFALTGLILVFTIRGVSYL